MKRISDKILHLLKGVLPAPFTIAIFLTVIAFAMVFIVGKPDDSGNLAYLAKMLVWWNDGMWNTSLLAFTVQMMLILVLGHILALSPPVNNFIDVCVAAFCKNGAAAAFSITLLTVLVAWFNWGLGLIFGAIIVRKTAEFAGKNKIALNYGLLGACGYSGLMVWHGGISGSSTTKVAEPGHLQSLVSNNTDLAEKLPESISFSETVFSTGNLTASLLLLIILPVFMYWLAKNAHSEIPYLFPESHVKEDISEKPQGAERIDFYKNSARIAGILFLATSLILALNTRGNNFFAFITPNWLNLLLFGMGLFAHGSIQRFIKAGDEAISGAAGILIQFPLYFGIMGLMSSSGLVAQIANVFVEISRESGNPESTFPFLTFVSASFLNIFIPSGGGQWAVQGPVIIQGAAELGMDLPKSILAMAYGDQLTNMLQPFWALPLLGITGLKAREILPYSMLLMCIGAVIFLGVLYFF